MHLAVLHALGCEHQVSPPSVSAAAGASAAAGTSTGVASAGGGAGPARHIEKYTGAEALEARQKLPVKVQVIGYPDATNRPITCVAPASSYDPGKLRQLVFDCGGYTDGTSGGPFLAHVSAKTGEGSVIGVIGGYQQGGNTPSISYSSKFLANVRALYKIATAAQASQEPGRRSPPRAG